jgi:MFS transporter, PAT family, beta-lactamase induction signal transducer AmpG
MDERREAAAEAPPAGYIVPGWRAALRLYLDPGVITVFLLGIASGLPLLLGMSTLMVRLGLQDIDRGAIGLMALTQLPYSLKFLWAPLFDRFSPPLPLGRRRGWGITVQLCLAGAILLLGSLDPATGLLKVAAAALTVGFLSASQDIVIDGYRIERLPPVLQGAGGGAALVGYRLGMLAGGGGALLIAHAAGWAAAYAAMAALAAGGTLIFLLAPEPARPDEPPAGKAPHWLAQGLVAPLRDFLRRPGAWGLLLFAILYKLSDTISLSMGSLLYLSVGFGPAEIAAYANVWSFPATVAGGLLGGWLVARHGVRPALVRCGLLQVLGIAGFAVQALAGHRIDVMIACAILEGVTGGMAWAAFVAFLSGLCRLPGYAATQYALLSSLMAIGRTLAAAPSGFLSQHLGWPSFFGLVALVNLGAVLLFIWFDRRWPAADPA